MKFQTILFLLLTSLTTGLAHANTCDAFNEEIPVQAGGRVKPLYVLASESIKFLTGKSKYKDSDSTVTFCGLISAGIKGETLDLPILVEHVESKKVLGLKESDKTMMASALMAQKDLVKSEIFKLKESNSYKKDLIKIYNRIETYESITSGKALTVYTSYEGSKVEWRSIVNYYDGGNAAVIEALNTSHKNYIKDHTDSYLLELTYVKSHVFTYAMLIALVAIFLTVLMKSMKAGVSLTLIVILIETVAMAMRVMISGRAPITNMYETVMFSGYGALVIALLILITKKDKVFLIAGLGYNILCLFMMMFANNMLSSSISPLVPVLRDNFWLSTHVSTIILSYAALALSWMVANITLLKLKMGKLTNKEYRHYQSLTYTCIKVGIILLSAGIILGGVWADYSWGRFWGWDPKETWSLIVLLFYMIILHGRYTSWINTHKFILMSAGGFMLVMMAWFGVNYILASGLHSYGFSEGGAIFLGVFFLVQTTIILICAKQPKMNKTSSSD
jgi:cytochrome c-type biogenesis protein CcsB